MEQEVINMYTSDGFKNLLKAVYQNLRLQVDVLNEMNDTNSRFTRKFLQIYDETRDLEDFAEFLRKFYIMTDEICCDYRNKRRHLGDKILPAEETVVKTYYEITHELCNIEKNGFDKEESLDLLEEEIYQAKKDNSFKVIEEHIEKNRENFKIFKENVILFECVNPPTYAYALDECSDYLERNKIKSKFIALGYNEEQIENFLFDYNDRRIGLQDNLAEMKKESFIYYDYMQQEQQYVNQFKISYNEINAFYRDEKDLREAKNIEK